MAVVTMSLVGGVRHVVQHPGPFAARSGHATDHSGGGPEVQPRAPITRVVLLPEQGFDRGSVVDRGYVATPGRERIAEG